MKLRPARALLLLLLKAHHAHVRARVLDHLRERKAINAKRREDGTAEQRTTREANARERKRAESIVREAEEEGREAIVLRIQRIRGPAGYVAVRIQ